MASLIDRYDFQICEFKGLTERASHFSLTIDLLCDVIVKLTHWTNERASGASGVLIALLQHKANKLKRKNEKPSECIKFK